MAGEGGLPAFHRRFRIVPEQGRVTTLVEDDYHHMRVALDHDGRTITHAAGEMLRAPWTTCPGAPAKLAETFTGMTLADARRAGEKTLNCTHLHDLATLAANHWDAPAPIAIAIVVTDPVDGRRTATLHRDGAELLRLVDQDNRIVEPVEIEGRTLFEINDWIKSLSPDLAEAARLLRWGAILAHGRLQRIESQSDATKMPPNCFTFQPGRREVAVRVGEVIDFTAAERMPLD